MSFDRIDLASRFVNIARNVARNEARRLSPPLLIGRMVSVDLSSKTGKCWLVGDATPVPVVLFQNNIPGRWDDKDQPLEVPPTGTLGAGSIVVLASFGGTLYVTDVLNGGQMVADLRIFNDTRMLMGPVGKITELSGENTIDEVFSSGEWSYRTASFGSFSGLRNTNALMFGPYTPFFNGTPGTWFEIGTLKIIVSCIDSYEHSAVKIFEFVLNPFYMFSDDDFFDSDNHFDRWFRVLPKSSITNDYAADSLSENWSKDGDFNLDIAMRKTVYGQLSDGTQSWELWLRIWPNAFTDAYPLPMNRDWKISIDTDVFGKAGSLQPDGRLRQIYDLTPPAPVGYVGFHNAHHIFHDSHDTTTKTPYFWDVCWDTGPWRSSELRLASDLQKTWTHSGLFSYDGTNIKWTGNILLDGLGRNTNSLTVGKAFISCPSSGTIPVMGSNGATVTCTSSGIPIAAGRSLWCGIPPGSANVDLKGFLFLVEGGSDAKYNLPEWAILIAARGTSGAIPEIQLGNGDKLDAWRAPTLQNSWVNWGSPYADAGYTMTDSGYVILRGLVKNGTGNTVLTLPAGFRPLTNHVFTCNAHNGTSDIAVRVDVQSDGQVVRISSSANTHLSLANVRFRAEQ